MRVTLINEKPFFVARALYGLYEQRMQQNVYALLFDIKSMILFKLYLLTTNFHWTDDGYKITFVCE